MTDDLEAALAALAAAPADRSLGDMEVQVCRTIAARRREAMVARSLRPVRVTAVLLALALGAVTGGAAAVSAIRASAAVGQFAAGNQLAPSTLLNGGP